MRECRYDGVQIRGSEDKSAYRRGSADQRTYR